MVAPNTLKSPVTCGHTCRISTPACIPECSQGCGTSQVSMHLARPCIPRQRAGKQRRMCLADLLSTSERTHALLTCLQLAATQEDIKQGGGATQHTTHLRAREMFAAAGVYGPILWLLVLC